MREVARGKIASLVLTGNIAKGQLMTTGTLIGTVSDSSGAAVPGAGVTITNVGTNTLIETVSNRVGRFSEVGLPVGNYRIAVKKTGFRVFLEANIYVGPATVRTVNAVLQPGSAVTQVNVTASPAQVQTSTSEISSQVSEQQVETLPLNGRTYQGLAALMPGGR